MGVIGSFQKIMVPPNHPFVHRGFSIIYKPSILGVITPYFWFNIHIVPTPWKMNGWNPRSWRVGSDDFPDFNVG